jgi:RNA polymerase sigma factor (sigma-70 family)
VEELTSLVIKAKTGDLAAYTDLVQRFQDMACGYAYSILSDFHLAQDAAQEAFLTAYGNLPDLKEPSAFPGWFRQIVFSSCTRLLDRKAVPTVSLSSVGPLPHLESDPIRITERRELHDRVLASLRGLPEDQRTVTTLFYINGYSTKDVSDFLEVPVTTVKKRLHDSRKRLKERMMDMVEETLKTNVPDERFSREIINKLLAERDLLKIDNHPVQKVWQTIHLAFPDYEVVTADEIETRQQFAAAEDHAWDLAYRLDEERSLRYQMTTVTMSAVIGRKPPVRLLAPGRVFRPDKEDAMHMKVFHQVDGVCIEAGLTIETFKQTGESILKAIIPDAQIEWVPCQ